MTVRAHEAFVSDYRAYRRFRPRYPSPLFEWISEPCSSFRLAWDCGSGNGQAAVDLATRFDTVYATDVCSAQIELAMQHPRVSYQVEVAERCSLPDASADLICAAEALHWFDATRFYQEVKRVAAPGAVFAAWNYGTCQIDADVDRVLSILKFEVLRDYWSPRAVIDSAAPMGIPWAGTSTEMQMCQVWSLLDLLGYIDTWSSVTAFRQHEHAHPLDSLRDSLVRAWGHLAERPVRWKLNAWRGHIDRSA